MDEGRGWLPRQAAGVLARALRQAPVVCLLGPRQCGKSTLAARLAPARPYLTLDDDTLLAAAQADPGGFVAGLPATVTLDEIQRAPGLLRAIKLAVDRGRRPGRFLLTGSADLLTLPTVSESLAGRMEIVRLHGLTEAEKRRRPGRFLARLLGGSFRTRIVDAAPAPRDLVRRLLEGGFPEAMRRPPARLRQWQRAYVESLVERDARDVATLRNPGHLRSLLTLLALQTAQLLNINAAAAHLGIRRETVENHLAALERLFLVRRLSAWRPNEARRLVKAPKIHVVDSGVAAALAGLTENDWLTERGRFGHLLESFVLEQLTAQAAATGADVTFCHYRDKDQLDVDVVVTRGRKVWGVEVKAGSSPADGDGRGLRRLADAAGRHFERGVVLYGGASTLAPAPHRIVHVPLSELWTD